MIKLNMDYEYQYTKEDLLKTPQKYQMSPYVGINFLISYKNSRNNILKILNQKDLEIQSLEEICEKFDSNFSDVQLFTDNKKDIFTKDILIQIVFYLIKNSNIKKIKKMLDIFIKNFEIKKQLFTRYDCNYKQSSENCSELINYSLLSTISLLYYEKTLNLKYLNVSLKLNDTLCSQIKKISDPVEVFLLKYSIEKELESISKLCQRSEIKF